MTLLLIFNWKGLSKILIVILWSKVTHFNFHNVFNIRLLYKNEFKDMFYNFHSNVKYNHYVPV